MDTLLCVLTSTHFFDHFHSPLLISGDMASCWGPVTDTGFLFLYALVIQLSHFTALLLPEGVLCCFHVSAVVPLCLPCEQASAESVPGPSVVPGGGWGAPHTHSCSQARARGRAAPVAEGNGAEEGLGAASWRQVDGWGAPAVSDSVGLSCICRVVLFMKYTDGNRCPYRGIKESFGLVSICRFKKKGGGG